LVIISLILVIMLYEYTKKVFKFIKILINLFKNNSKKHKIFHINYIKNFKKNTLKILLIFKAL